MFKQLVITIALFSFLGVITHAQEKPETVKKEKQKCSMSCCANKEMHSDMKMDDIKEMHKQMEYKNSLDEYIYVS